MTLDKAITDLETEYKSDFNLQLANWLKELKAYKEGMTKETLTNTTDQFVKNYKDNMSALRNDLEKPKPCEEAISRQDALDALHMCLSTNSYDDDVTGDSYICYEEAEYEIEKLQSVQPKPIDCEDAISREDALMCMTGEFSPAVIYKPEDIISKRIQRIKALPPVTPRSLNPEADREESKAYCAECDHIEMCSWYPHDGCEWLKTDRYNAGYNAAKREIALSGEYERAYERGKADAHPDKYKPESEVKDDNCAGNDQNA